MIEQAHLGWRCYCTGWTFNPWMERGELVLLLDGLDEILGERHAGTAESVYAAVSNEIQRIAVRFPDCSSTLR